MGFEADEEILQDFLVEAGEILELLGEQLVELERSPEDSDLLNAIFRGFHTVKGGAGFLQLGPLVDCCHAAENVFDVLRRGERRVTSELMDTVLRALDSVNEMFSCVSSGVMPEPADAELLDELHHLANGSDEPMVVEEIEAEPEVPEAVTAVDEGGDDTAKGKPGEDITDQEFEDLLDAIQPQEPAAQKPSISSDSAPKEPIFEAGAEDGDEISDDEFEALLDQIHGQGKFMAAEASEQEPVTKSEEVASIGAESDSDEISDEEFEALLDQLHGKGKFTGAINEASEPAQKNVPTNTKPPSPENKVTARPDPKPADKPVEQKPVVKTTAAKPEVVKAAEPKAVAAPAKAPVKTTVVTMPEKNAAAQETTVRVDTKRLDDIMNMVGELVLVRNRLVRLSDQHNDEGLQKAVANLDVVTADLQTSVMKTRMQPIKKVFGRFPRVVRDLARNLKKEVNLELVGEETDLDKNLVEALADPLVHLVRNSVDHGVESPDVREQKNKSRTGRIVLAAQQEGDHILLTIEDDGAGMDPNKLKSLAVKRGVMDQDTADRLSDKECYNLIFAPGFSTKEQISDVSGRGVGMDVVKTKITQLNGTIDIDSEIDRGTRIMIKVPLTLAIMPTLMVMLKDQAFALPLVNVNEIFHLDISKTNVVDGKEVVVVRGKPLPLYHLGSWLINGAQHGQSGSAHVVVVSVGTQKVGFVVDQLVGQEEVVIKPLGKMLHGTPGMAGATITGDGRIALILDVPSMLKHYA
ncbi:chemotaxis protein CheA [Gynuella sunshinyii]|uniref:Chemotaxis protein CheA n=1 Tax=Gynuella sunshinyii YC6258 TaxID=1445510 RepID=A0A0C5VXM2_9GAMM|nr:chemotaxis protein CheA [Gynuella sunshinyii]AJQ95159.1 chemotaxis protein histidine kinase and related kinase [Gynuella sunshinyii YC6258]